MIMPFSPPEQKAMAPCNSLSDATSTYRIDGLRQKVQEHGMTDNSTDRTIKSENAEREQGLTGNSPDRIIKSENAEDVTDLRTISTLAHRGWEGASQQGDREQSDGPNRKRLKIEGGS